MFLKHDDRSPVNLYVKRGRYAKARLGPTAPEMYKYGQRGSRNIVIVHSKLIKYLFGPYLTFPSLWQSMLAVSYNVVFHNATLPLFTVSTLQL